MSTNGEVPSPSGVPMSSSPSHAAPGAACTQEAYDDLSRRYEHVRGQMLEATRESGELVKLYVVMRRLYEARNRQDLLDAVSEIIVSVIGSECFGIFELDSRRGTLDVAASMGIDPQLLTPESLKDTEVGRLLPMGERFVGRPGRDDLGLPVAPAVAAVVPLRLGELPAGAIVLFQLLPHRHELESGDLELLDLLSEHAAPALRVAELKSGASSPYHPGS